MTPTKKQDEIAILSLVVVAIILLTTISISPKFSGPTIPENNQNMAGLATEMTSPTENLDEVINDCIGFCLSQDNDYDLCETTCQERHAK